MRYAESGAELYADLQLYRSIQTTCFSSPDHAHIPHLHSSRRIASQSEIILNMLATFGPSMRPNGCSAQC